MSDTVLEVRNLKKDFDLGHGQMLKAVDDVSFSFGVGEWWENPAAEKPPAGVP